MAAPNSSRRRQDAEAALNLYPGFRFHPTDDELVHSYLLPHAAHRPIPVNIIAEIDLYKFNPWELPEKALFGQKEWYFFTPRDRKYPNGSRPNRAAASGYWKATGADRLVMPPGYGKPVGIKKALVFYHGKAPKGVKTDWIMHEYRIADTNRSATTNKRSLRLDDVVLCRLYNKKNAWVMPQQFGGGETSESMDFKSESVWTPESEVTHGSLPDHADLEHADLGQSEVYPTMMAQTAKDEGNDWFMGLNLDDLGTSMGLPHLGVSSQDCYFPQPPMGLNDELPPF